MDKRDQLMGLFRQLNLKGFIENYEDICQGNKSTDQILLQLCEQEIDRRYSARVKRRIKQAGFPKIKTLAMLCYYKTPRLPKQTVETLSTCKFINQKENVILVGDSGGGKTHLAIALGIQACRQDFSVKFFTACQLANALIKAYADGEIEKFMTKIRKYQLVIIDKC